MAKSIIVKGRTICSVCDTDKSWSMTVDRAQPGEKHTTDYFIKDAITRQNKEVVDPNHIDHKDQLVKTVRILK